MSKTKVFWFIQLPTDFYKKHEIQYLMGSGKNGFKKVMAYQKMICDSANHDCRLRFSETIPYTPALIAPLIWMRKEEAREFISQLKKIGLLEIEKDGSWHLVGAEKMVESKTDAAFRMKDLRDQEKSVSGKDENLNISAHKSELQNVVEESSDETPTFENEKRTKGEQNANNVRQCYASVHPSTSHSVSVKSKSINTPLSKPLSPSDVTPGDMQDEGRVAAGSELSKELRKTALDFYRLYPKRQQGIIDSVYGWFKDHNPNEDDMASIRSFLKECIKSDDWKKRMSDSPDLRYLPSIINFLNAWAGHRTIESMASEPTEEESAEDAANLREIELYNKARSMDDAELIQMKADGKMAEGDAFSNELQRRGLSREDPAKPAQSNPGAVTDAAIASMIKKM